MVLVDESTHLHHTNAMKQQKRTYNEKRTVAKKTLKFLEDNSKMEFTDILSNHWTASRVTALHSRSSIFLCRSFWQKRSSCRNQAIIERTPTSLYRLPHPVCELELLLTGWLSATGKFFSSIASTSMQEFHHPRHSTRPDISLMV